MLRMADACQESNRQRFQDMYVQRFNNVRYVDFELNPLMTIQQISCCQTFLDTHKPTFFLAQAV